MTKKQEFERDFAPDQPLLTRLNALRKYRAGTIRAVGLWLSWMSVMIGYSMLRVGWPFSQAQYFALSSLSTGGLWSIPEDSEQWLYGVTGVFAAFGVPIMGVAMASLAKLFVNTGDINELKETLSAPVTALELRTMNDLGLEDGDGLIERSEFIILCMMRLGTDPGVIEYINERYNELDEDGDGTLTLREITKRKSITLDRILSNRDLQSLQELDADTSVNDGGSRV